MSSTNKHRTNQHNSLSLNYMNKELGPRKACPKRNCKGTCVPVLVRYKDHGPINNELECCLCGKVIKDPKFREERERRWKKRKKNFQNKPRKKPNNDKKKD